MKNDTEKLLTYESQVPGHYQTFHTSGIPNITLLSWTIMRFKTLLPWIVLQSVLLDDHAHTHASQFLLSLGRVNDPTPVLSDTCFSPLSQSEKRGNLCWHEINLGRVRGNHNTTLICVCHCSPLPDSLTHRERHIQTEEVEIKGTYSV